MINDALERELKYTQDLIDAMERREPTWQERELARLHNRCVHTGRKLPGVIDLER